MRRAMFALALTLGVSAAATPQGDDFRAWVAAIITRTEASETRAGRRWIGQVLPLRRDRRRVGTAVLVCGRISRPGWPAPVSFEELALEVERTRFWVRRRAETLPYQERQACRFDFDGLDLPLSFVEELGSSSFERSSVDFRPSGAFLVRSEETSRWGSSDVILGDGRWPGQTTLRSFEADDPRVLDHVTLTSRWSPPLHRTLPLHLRLENDTVLLLKASQRDRPVVVYVEGERLEVLGQGLTVNVKGTGFARVYATPNAARGFLVGPSSILQVRQLLDADWLPVSSHRDLVASLDDHR